MRRLKHHDPPRASGSPIMGDISRHFNRSEFACKCGCGFDSIDSNLISNLDMMRERIGQPFKIHSGCRCEAYNKQVGGEDNSAHTRGKAADVGMPGSVFRYVFLRMAFGLFNRIGVYPTFCHVDVDDSLPQTVVWVGKQK